ncbi:MAG: XRE family transcriptional regulator [Gammaproteobacteria bacterium]|nr:XRE family transcriptional regulator [Gammaproteobacteria bacterium]
MTIKYQNEAWFIALKEALQTTSQAKLAAKCGISGTAVNQVLKGAYPGSIENVAEKVKGALLKQSVVCPVLDVITTDICASHRNKGFMPNNPMRVSLYKACQRCLNNPKADSHE